jgi:multidrug resistance efflux pump
VSFKNRLKFFFGIVFAILLAGALAVYLNNALSTLHTTRANLRADSLTVGTDYPGLVVKLYVQEGDKVTKGQMLLEIRSQQLSDALLSGQVSATALPYSLNKTNQNIILTASDDGVIQKLFYQSGAYVPTGGIVATIDTVNSLYVEAHYSLTPPDYARIRKGDAIIVTFPDNSRIAATVSNISLVGNGAAVDTVIKAHLRSANLADFRFAVGTPVQATLKLTTKTWYQTLTDFTRKLFRPVAR